MELLCNFTYIFVHIVQWNFTECSKYIFLHVILLSVSMIAAIILVGSSCMLYQIDLSHRYRCVLFHQLGSSKPFVLVWSLIHVLNYDAVGNWEISHVFNTWQGEYVEGMFAYCVCRDRMIWYDFLLLLSKPDCSFAK